MASARNLSLQPLAIIEWHARAAQSAERIDETDVHQQHIFRPRFTDLHLKFAVLQMELRNFHNRSGSRYRFSGRAPGLEKTMRQKSEP